eukprot:TRINITY_DN1498_c0_g1_i1.p1 TRINITY_DN1498_c0_g1~~TRINITY_DN1498_c0_g1_i1.p1  ORF type:complete len:148 (+),score=49.81 TRINITY_DN1498_c0_g1_i1:80-523(+)
MGAPSMRASLLPALLALALLAPASAFSVTQSINVRPDHPDSATVTHGGYSCSFAFECSGGSSEMWEVALEGDEGGEITCMITRPEKASYLYFTFYTAIISGAQLTSAEVWDNDSALLQGDAFVIDSSSVSSARGWSGVVHMIGMEAE